METTLDNTSLAYGLGNAKTEQNTNGHEELKSGSLLLHEDGSVADACRVAGASLKASAILLNQMNMNTDTTWDVGSTNRIRTSSRTRQKHLAGEKNFSNAQYASLASSQMNDSQIIINEGGKPNMEANIISHIAQGDANLQAVTLLGSANVNIERQQESDCYQLPLIQSCLTRDCRVKIERLKASKSLLRTDEFLSDLLTSVTCSTSVDFLVVHKAKHSLTQYNYTYPGDDSPELRGLMIDPSIKAINNMVENHSQNGIMENVEEHDDFLEPFLAQSCETQKSEPATNETKQDLIGLSGRSSQSMKTKFIGELENVRDKVSVEIQSPASLDMTKDGTLSSKSKEMMTPVKELRVLLEPLPMEEMTNTPSQNSYTSINDELVDKDHVGPDCADSCTQRSTMEHVESLKLCERVKRPSTKKQENAATLIADSSAFSDTDTSSAVSDGDYVPSDEGDDSLSEEEKPVKLPYKLVSSETNGHESKPKPFKFKVLIIRQNNEEPQLLASKKVLLPACRSKTVGPNTFVGTHPICHRQSSKAVEHTLEVAAVFEQPTQKVSDDKNLATGQVEDHPSDIKASAWNLSQETNQTGKPDLTMEQGGARNNTNISMESFLLPAIEACDKSDTFMCNLPSISQMSLTDIPLPTASPSINCNLDQLLPSEQEYFQTYKDLTMDSPRETSAFHLNKLGSSPLPPLGQVRCGEALGLKLGAELVQLDGSPESSSAESETEAEPTPAHKSYRQSNSLSCGQQLNMGNSDVQMAAAKAADGDRELITSTLLEEMINRTVCDCSHKGCTAQVGCSRGSFIYLNELEKQRIYSVNPVPKGFEQHCQPDDETEIVRDLLYDMTNRVICQVEHSSKTTGVRRCRPGEICCHFKKIHKDRQPPNRLLKIKNARRRRKKSMKQTIPRNSGSSKASNRTISTKKGKSKPRSSSCEINGTEVGEMLEDSLLISKARPKKPSRQVHSNSSHNNKRGQEDDGRTNDQASQSNARPSRLTTEVVHDVTTLLPIVPVTSSTSVKITEKTPLQSGSLIEFPPLELLADNQKGRYLVNQSRRRKGQRSKSKPNSLGADASSPPLTMEAALLKSIEGDRKLVIASLMEEMLNKTVCSANHKSCLYSVDCRRGSYIYMTEKEKRRLYADYPVAKGFEQHCQPDDETEIVRDLLYDMTNRVICQVEHLSETTGVRKCRPGEICCHFKKIHKDKRFPTTGLRARNQQTRKPRGGCKVVKTVKITKGKIKTKRLVKAAAVLKGNKVRKKRQQKEAWSNRDIDNSVPSSGDVDGNQPEALVADPKPSSKATPANCKGKRSGATKTETGSKTDKLGKKVPLDLSVDVVLPDTSSDEVLSEADSAGETTSRRQNLRRKKKRVLPKEEREKLREQMIAQRRTTLKYMGTPRSLVLAQLVQEEAQKQCAEILLPKNLPVYEPESPCVRPFIFPLELKLTPEDIAAIINRVIPSERTPPGFDTETVVSEMCEVQASGVVPDSQLLYQLSMFISSSTTEPFSLHQLIQVVAEHSCQEQMRCPLPACNSQLYDNWSQVGTHLLLHLPPVYLRLMSEAFRCRTCWAGFPTPYHHTEHHHLKHPALPYSPALLTGFPSSALTSFWASEQFASMVFLDWPASLTKDKREAVEDFSSFLTGAPPPPAPSVYKCSEAAPLQQCLYVSDEVPDCPLSQTAETSPVSPAKMEEMTENECSEMNSELTEERGDNSDKNVAPLYEQSCIADVHVDEGVQCTVVCAEDGTSCFPEPREEAPMIGYSETYMERASEELASDLLREMTEEVEIKDLTAYLCWFCARPFIGRMSFYIHLLQEILAMPASGLLSGCVFADEAELTSCHLCDKELTLSELQPHLSSHHQTEASPDTNPVGGDHADCTKPARSCPCVGCHERFSDWITLGDHVVTVHTAHDCRAMIKHACTFCGDILPSYYHARAHWDNKPKCFLNSRPDAAEPFIGHALPFSYWTEDLLCTHDITFTKHKKYTFCSTYKSSPHVMCFICHKLFYRDPNDLNFDPLSETVHALQRDLADHMTSSHQICLSTGSVIKDLGEDEDGASQDVEGVSYPTDANDCAEYTDKQEDIDNETNADTEAAVTNMSLPVGEMETTHDDDISKSVYKCRIHSAKNFKHSEMGGLYCKKCTNIKIWVSSLTLGTKYSYVMNGVDIKYCNVHTDALIALHESVPYLSYCISCYEVGSKGSRIPAEYYCEQHGPWTSGKPCIKCKKPVKRFTETMEGKNKVQLSEYIEKESGGASDEPVESFSIMDMTEGGEADGDINTVPITYTSDLPKSTIKPSGGQAETLLGSTSDAMRRKEELPSSAYVGQLNTGAFLVTDKCSFHPQSSVFSCEIKFADKRTTICRVCRLLGMKEAFEDAKLLKPKESRYCRSHPTSPVASVNNNNNDHCCVTCAKIKLKSDILCSFHETSNLNLTKSTKEVIGCQGCASACIANATASSLRCLWPSNDIHCLIHPTAILSSSPSCTGKAAILFCSTCALITVPVLYHCETHGHVEPRSCAQSGSDKNVVCGVCFSPVRLKVDLNSIGDQAKNQTSSTITADDLALCYSLFHSKTNPVKDEHIAPVTEDDTFTYVKDSNTLSEDISQSVNARLIPDTESVSSQLDVLGQPENTALFSGTDTKISHRCPLCDDKWQDEDHYESHMRLVHNAKRVPKIYLCSQCSFSSTSKDGLSMHEKSQHPREKLKTDSSLNAIVVHKSLKSVNLRSNVDVKLTPSPWRVGHKFYCVWKRCGKVMTSQTEYDEHVKRNHPGRNAHTLIPCQHCFYVSLDDKAATNHLSLHRGKMVFPCKYCNLLLDDSVLLTDHWKMCLAKSGERSTQEIEERTSEPKNGVNEEETPKENQKRGVDPSLPSWYHCPKCDYAHFNRHMFRHHILLHGKTAVKCPGCPYLASQPRSIKRHQLRGDCGKHVKHNTMPKPYTDTDIEAAADNGRVGSPEQSKESTNEKTEEAWMKLPDGSESCSRCGYVCSSPQERDYHDNVHNNSKALRCSKCYLLTETLADMATHLVTCKGVQPPPSQPPAATCPRGNPSGPPPSQPPAATCLREGSENTAGQKIRGNKPSFTFKKSNLARLKNRLRRWTNQVNRKKEGGTLLTDNSSEWKNHVLLCPRDQCKYVITGDKDYKEHFEKAHPGVRLYLAKRCIRCPFVCRDRITLEKHLQRHDNSATLTCSNCFYIVLTKKYLDAHMVRCGPAFADFNRKITIRTLAKKRLSSGVSSKGALKWNGHMYRCIACGYDVKGPDDYIKHMLEHPSRCVRTLQLCKICPYVTEQSQSLVRHMELHDDSSAIRCSHGGCGHLSASIQFSQKHAKRCLYARDRAQDNELPDMLTERKYACRTQKEDKKFQEKQGSKCQAVDHSIKRRKRKSSYDRHKKNTDLDISKEGITADSPKSQLLCDHCDHLIASREDFNHHMATAHPNQSVAVHYKPYYCSQCPFAVLTQARMQTHTRCHSLTNAWKCPNCWFLGKSKVYLRSHLKRCRFIAENQRKEKLARLPKRGNPIPICWGSWNDHKFRCFCGYDVTGVDDYQEHTTEKHPGVTPNSLHMCPRCPHVSINYYHHMNHVAAHESPKALKCPHCSFICLDRLEYHMRICIYARDEQMDFQIMCRTCGKIYKSRFTYHDHMRQAHGKQKPEKLLFCSQCPFISVTSLEYVKHIARHSSHLAATCRNCSFIAKSKEHLWKHESLCKTKNVKVFRKGPTRIASSMPEETVKTEPFNGQSVESRRHLGPTIMKKSAAAKDIAKHLKKSSVKLKRLYAHQIAKKCATNTEELSATESSTFGVPSACSIKSEASSMQHTDIEKPSQDILPFVVNPNENSESSHCPPPLPPDDSSEKPHEVRRPSTSDPSEDGFRCSQGLEELLDMNDLTIKSKLFTVEGHAAQASEMSDTSLRDVENMGLESVLIPTETSIPSRSDETLTGSSGAVPPLVGEESTMTCNLNHLQLPTIANADNRAKKKGSDIVELPQTQMLVSKREEESKESMHNEIETMCVSTSDLSNSTALEAMSDELTSAAAPLTDVGTTKDTKGEVPTGNTAGSDIEQDDDDDEELVVKRTTVCYTERRRVSNSPSKAVPASYDPTQLLHNQHQAAVNTLFQDETVDSSTNFVSEFPGKSSSKYFVRNSSALVEKNRMQVVSVEMKPTLPKEVSSCKLPANIVETPVGVSTLNMTSQLPSESNNSSELVDVSTIALPVQVSTSKDPEFLTVIFNVDKLDTVENLKHAPCEGTTTYSHVANSSLHSDSVIQQNSSAESSISANVKLPLPTHMTRSTKSLTCVITPSDSSCISADELPEVAKEVSHSVPALLTNDAVCDVTPKSSESSNGVATASALSEKTPIVFSETTDVKCCPSEAVCSPQALISKTKSKQKRCKKPKTERVVKARTKRVIKQKTKRVVKAKCTALQSSKVSAQDACVTKPDSVVSSKLRNPSKRQRNVQSRATDGKRGLKNVRQSNAKDNLKKENVQDRKTTSSQSQKRPADQIQTGIFSKKSKRAQNKADSPTTLEAVQKVSSRSTDDLLETPENEERDFVTPEKRKKKIKLHEYLKRGPRSRDEHCKTSTAGTKKPIDTADQKCGVYGITTNLSPNTIMSMKKQFLESRGVRTETENRLRAIDYVLDRTNISSNSTAGTHLCGNLSSSNISHDPYKNLTYFCSSCNVVLHGLKDIIYHTDFHSFTHCFQCNRRFDDIDYLHSHIATNHLNIQLADFERWKYIIGKKHELPFEEEEKQAALLSPVLPLNHDEPSELTVIPSGKRRSAENRIETSHDVSFSHLLLDSSKSSNTTSIESKMEGSSHQSDSVLCVEQKANIQETPPVTGKTENLPAGSPRGELELQVSPFSTSEMQSLLSTSSFKFDLENKASQKRQIVTCSTPQEPADDGQDSNKMPSDKHVVVSEDLQFKTELHRDDKSIFSNNSARVISNEQTFPDVLAQQKGPIVDNCGGQISAENSMIPKTTKAPTQAIPYTDVDEGATLVSPDCLNSISSDSSVYSDHSIQNSHSSSVIQSVDHPKASYSDRYNRCPSPRVREGSSHRDRHWSQKRSRSPCKDMDLRLTGRPSSNWCRNQDERDRCGSNVDIGISQPDWSRDLDKHLALDSTNEDVDLRHRNVRKNDNSTHQSFNYGLSHPPTQYYTSRWNRVSGSIGGHNRSHEHSGAETRQYSYGRKAHPSGAAMNLVDGSATKAPVVSYRSSRPKGSAYQNLNESHSTYWTESRSVPSQNSFSEKRSPDFMYASSGQDRVGRHSERTSEPHYMQHHNPKRRKRSRSKGGSDSHRHSNFSSEHNSNKGHTYNSKRENFFMDRHTSWNERRTSRRGRVSDRRSRNDSNSSREHQRLPGEITSHGPQRSSESSRRDDTTSYDNKSSHSAKCDQSPSKLNQHRHHKHNSYDEQEVLMTTHDGQLVRLKSGKTGELELA